MTFEEKIYETVAYRPLDSFDTVNDGSNLGLFAAAWCSVRKVGILLGAFKVGRISERLYKLIFSLRYVWHTITQKGNF